IHGDEDLFSVFFDLEQGLGCGIVNSGEGANLAVEFVFHGEADDFMEVELVFPEFRKEAKWQLDVTFHEVIDVRFCIYLFKFNSKKIALLQCASFNKEWDEIIVVFDNN